MTSDDLVKRLRAWHAPGETITGDVQLYLDAADEIERLRSELEKARNAGLQALRQWKMYADMTDGAEDFEKSAEGSVYSACKSLLSGEAGNVSEKSAEGKQP